MGTEFLAGFPPVKCATGLRYTPDRANPYILKGFGARGKCGQKEQTGNLGAPWRSPTQRFTRKTPRMFWACSLPADTVKEMVMSEIDYVKILRAYISEVAHMEGTDFLGSKGDQCLLMDLDEAENAELTRIRDEVRAEDGWPGYDPATPQGER